MFVSKNVSILLRSSYVIIAWTAGMHHSVAAWNIAWDARTRASKYKEDYTNHPLWGTNLTSCPSLSMCLTAWTSYHNCICLTKDARRWDECFLVHHWTHLLSHYHWLLLYKHGLGLGLLNVNWLLNWLGICVAHISVSLKLKFLLKLIWSWWKETKILF